MNNVFVYIELENGVPADVSLELLTKGRELATTLGVKLEAVVLGHNLGDIAQELAKYGADTVWTADDKEFAPFRTLPHTAVMCGLIEQEKPQIALFGATSIGRDFAPRVSSALFSGLTADCTQLVIGDHKDAKTGTEYENLLYQIRPAFGGNIIATIVNPDHRPQMATVREGVMRKEYAAKPGAGEVKPIDWKKFLKESDLVVKILDRQIEERKINIKGASVVVAGGYGVGSKENFKLIHELAEVLGGEVGEPCCGGRRFHGACPPDRSDGRYDPSQTLHRVRYFGPDPAYGRYGPVVDDHLDQHRSRCADQQDRRLCDHGRPERGDPEND